MKLSIVIPVLGRLHLLEHSLVSVLENRPDDCEVLVVLSAPYHDPYALAGEVQFIEARRGAKLIELVSAGVAASRAQIVHVLGCGVEVSDGWTAAPLRQFKDPGVAAVSPLVLDVLEREQIVSAGVGYRKGGSMPHIGAGKSLASLGPWAADMVGPSLLAGFYRKSLVESLGGWDAHLGAAGAAADLALRWKGAGFRTVLDPKSKVFAPHAACDIEAGAFAAALSAERMFLRQTPSGQWTTALAAHAVVAGIDVCRSLPRPASLLKLLGRALAWTSFSACRRKQRRFADLAAQVHAASQQASPAVPRPHLARFGGVSTNGGTHREAA